MGCPYYSGQTCQHDFQRQKETPMAVLRLETRQAKTQLSSLIGLSNIKKSLVTGPIISILTTTSGCHAANIRVVIDKGRIISGKRSTVRSLI
eukprot:scaffold310475_cov19-Prasinocladus_malaysianus.AAC.1